MYDHGSDQSTAAALAFVSTFIGIIALMTLVLLAIMIYLYWRIAEKAGFSGAWSLLTLVPLGNLVLVILFAVVEWPLEAKARRLQLALSGRSMPSTPSIAPGPSAPPSQPAPPPPAPQPPPPPSPPA